jgi:hypothetical protein
MVVNMLDDFFISFHFSLCEKNVVVSLAYNI